MNKNDQWFTPPHVIEKVKLVLDEIDLDPASCEQANRIVGAIQYFDEEIDGLSRDWHGRIFLNPPYSNALIKRFTKKLDEQFALGNVSEFICLTNQGTDTLWNEPLRRYLQAFTIGRLAFVRPDGSMDGGTSRGQCFTYGGPNIKRFIEIFNDNDFSYVANYNHIRS